MIIRQLKRDELPKLLRLYAHLHEQDDPLPNDAVLNKIWEKIQNSNSFFYFGVFDRNENLQSSCTISIIPNFTRGARPYGLIENVVTKKVQRNKGYATKLLQKVQEFAWKYDCYKVMLLTGRNDEKIMKFYESAGFQRGKKTGFIAYPS